jgi:PAS domain S-box-containing protein
MQKAHPQRPVRSKRGKAHGHRKQKKQRSASRSTEVIQSGAPVDRKEEAALRDTIELYKRFFEEDLTADFVSTPDGRILACNLAFARLFGYDSVEEVMKQNAGSFYPNVDARKKLLHELMQKKKLEHYQVELRDRHGEPLSVIENVIGEFNEQGELVEIRGYLFDNTAMTKLEKKFVQMQNVPNIATLAGGFTHDFNNVFGIIVANANVLKTPSLPQERFEKSVDSILKAAQRGVGVVRRLEHISREMEKSPEAFSLSKGLILLVEYEKMLRTLLKTLLEERGYRILTAKDGREAVRLYKRHKDRISLVFSEMVLPKLGGWEAFLKMKKFNPELKVILSSGYVDSKMKSEILQAGAVDLIQKPFSPSEILNTVERIITTTKEKE